VLLDDFEGVVGVVGCCFVGFGVGCGCFAVFCGYGGFGVEAYEAVLGEFLGAFDGF